MSRYKFEWLNATLTWNDSAWKGKGNQMRIIKATIEGTAPLLLNAFTVLPDGPGGSGNGPSFLGDKGTPREQAERALYWSQDEKRLIVPGMNVYRSIIDAGTFHKLGKSKVTTLKSSLIPSGIMLLEIELPITPQDWEVDVRPVVIPSTGGRILRYRPRFDEWSLSFTLEVDTAMFAPKFVRQIVDDAGKRIGLGDFRPARKGPFGRYVVTDWEVGE
jgi:hypothetical protein